MAGTGDLPYRTRDVDSSPVNCRRRRFTSAAARFRNRRGLRGGQGNAGFVTSCPGAADGLVGVGTVVFDVRCDRSCHRRGTLGRKSRSTGNNRIDNARIQTGGRTRRKSTGSTKRGRFRMGIRRCERRCVRRGACLDCRWGATAEHHWRPARAIRIDFRARGICDRAVSSAGSCPIGGCWRQFLRRVFDGADG